MSATTVALARPRPSARLLAAAATLLALAVVLAAGLVAGALPASAHDALLKSVPADGQTVERAPDAVLLTFTEAPLETGAQVVVTGPDGAQVEVGELAFDAAAAGVSAALPTDVAGGTYTVAWHVVSSDGHPIEGSFSYAVPEPAAEPSQTAATAEPSATPEATSRADVTIQAETSVEGDDLTVPVPTAEIPAPLVVAGSIAAAAVVAAAAFFAVRRKIQDNEELRRNKPSEPTEPSEPSEPTEPEDPENPKQP